MKHNLAILRREYTLKILTPESVNPDPIVQFELWLDEAITAKVSEPTAMTLATAGNDGKPSARIVLLKDVNESGLSFFTSYESPKGRQLSENPRAAIVFFWPELERQVRFEGITSKLPGTESDRYFMTRPRGSGLGAWASRQSSVIASRGELEKEAEKFGKLYKNKAVPRPPFWGGYRLSPETAEFWQGRPDRLHDRVKYDLTGSSWKLTRLSP